MLQIPINRRKIMLSQLLLLVAVLIFINGCGSASNHEMNHDDPNHVSTESPNTPVTPNAPDNEQENDDPCVTPDPQEPSDGAKEGSENPSEPEEPTTIEKKYHMNKNYIIVPNDPETNKKVVLLTFDDGPKEYETTMSLLDTLDKHGAKAIFFVNGYRVKAQPELLELIAERGQIIGNHSWDHINLKEETSESIQEQIVKVQEIVQDIIGEKPQFFRPPFGAANDSVKQIVKDEDMLFMTWSNGSLDWDMGHIAIDERPAAIIKNVMDQLHSGSNILMHELSWTAEALDELLTQLSTKGYEFVDPRSIELEMRSS